MPLMPVAQVGAAGAVAQLYDNTASGDIASWDVSGLSGAYNHLLIVALARGTTVASVVTGYLRFNNDAAGNYGWGNIYGTGTSVAASQGNSVSQIELGAFSAASATAGFATQTQVLIPCYAQTTFTKMATVQGSGFWSMAAGDWQTRTFAGVWNNTAAITRVTVLPASGNWVAGSRLTIYGLI